MIDVTALKPKDVGLFVIYQEGLFVQEKGRIKSWHHDTVYVVFKCNQRWEDYKNYTGEGCNPEHLTFENGRLK